MVEPVGPLGRGIFEDFKAAQPLVPPDNFGLYRLIASSRAFVMSVMTPTQTADGAFERVGTGKSSL